jgi:hypothetical protein
LGTIQTFARAAEIGYDDRFAHAREIRTARARGEPPMAKSYEAPAGVDIASLKGKKKSTAVDLMLPGPGTPWEDRGNLGLVKAFVQTCVKSITQPAMLLDHIRRPDTSNEASQFAYGCAALWAISVAIHTVLYYLVFPPPAEWELDANMFYLKGLIFGLVAGAGVYVLCVMFARRMYLAMVSTELKNAAPPVLLHNMFCYSLGPSLLAPIPVLGPPAALLFIFLAWVVGGGKRLYISWRGAIVAAVLTMIAVLAMAALGGYVINMVLNNLLGVGKPDWLTEREEQQKANPAFGGAKK